MTHPDPHSAPHITVIGGGIVGLWCARMAARRGATVTLHEAATIGAGASGGMLGALMPHQPTGWNDKKQFQLDGLLSLHDEIAALEAETGIATGYGRHGRLMPISNGGKRRQSELWADAANGEWPLEGQWHVRDESPRPDWLNPQTHPHGINHDTLSARINPRLYMQAMHKAAIDHPAITIIENSPFSAAHLAAAEGPVILAAGLGTFDLMAPWWPSTLESGRGVKGQGALVKTKTPAPTDLPILYENGIYVIVHDNALVAIGSTSENEFDDASTTDEKLDEIIARAQNLCPPLAGCEIVERWAGVRPRAPGREPLIGPLPGASHIHVATGGFKISFAIAHLMAKAAVQSALGEIADMPNQFAVPRRIADLSKQISSNAAKPR